MNIREYIIQHADLYNLIYKFIDGDDSFENIKGFLNSHQSFLNGTELKSFLRLLKIIANEHKRNQILLDKIKEILKFIQENIQQNVSKIDLCGIFLGNKLILLFLLDSKIITAEDIKDKFNSPYYIDYKCFFYPEIKNLVNSKDKITIEQKLSELDSDTLNNFEMYRQIGENHTHLCSLIRSDNVQDFIGYINENEIDPSEFSIKPSIFESHLILRNHKSMTLIEYATFFGSLKIYQYLKAKKVTISPSLMIYAIHSRNYRLIHQIEEDIQDTQEKEIYAKCFRESIKCHHNEIADYFANKIEEKSTVLLSFEFHNFYSISEDEICNVKLKELFYIACKHNYINLLQILFEMRISFDATKAFENARESQDAMQLLLDHRVTGTENFTHCKKVSHVRIPSFIEQIEKSSFENCSNLRKVEIPTSVKSIESSCFAGCSSLKEVTIPSSVKKISENAFGGCSSLTKVTIPSSITSIREYAFSGCSSLQQIDIPSSVEDIGSNAFSGCSSLEKVIIPPLIKIIEYGTFYGCISLKKVTIPPSVTNIEHFAFYGCAIDPESIPSTVTDVDSYAFDDCYKLKQILQDRFHNQSKDETLNLDDYEIGKSLASNVHEAIDKKTGQKVVIKSFDDSTTEYSTYIFNAYTLTNIGIPGVAKIHCYLDKTFINQDKEEEEEEENINGMKIFGYTVIKDYMKNGNLYDNTLNYLKYKGQQDMTNMNPTIRSKIIFGIAAIMKKIHKLGMIHQHLSMQNILLDDNYEPVISSFGRCGSKVAYQTDYSIHLAMRQHTDDDYFIPPEIFSDDGATTSSDVYSYAMIVYMMFAGKKNTRGKHMIIHNAIKGKRYERLDVIPDHYWNLIEVCWDQNPEYRPSFDEIIDHLKDDIFAINEFGMKTNLDELHEYQDRIDAD